MQRAPVNSSAIKSVGYDPQTKAMHVEFSSGGVYHYPNVEPHEHQALVRAGSIGSHFHRNFRLRRAAPLADC